ncbi:MAG: diguanylate cyclase [Solirubrobacterales bacterium]
MSFRLRLTLFFVLIVVLPIVALMVLVSEIAADSESGKVDARLSAGLRTATTVYDAAQAESRPLASRVADRLAADPAATEALRSGDRGELEDVADDLVGGRVASATLTGRGGTSAEAGEGRQVAAAAIELASGGETIGSVAVSGISSNELLDRISQATGEQAAIVGPRGPTTGDVEIEASALPESGETATVDAEGGELRAAVTEPLGIERVRVALFSPAADAAFFSSRPGVAIALAVFLAAALIAVGFVLRSLQGQIREMLGAARRIGGGDFSGEVPVSGRDEMAGLATEFNLMSDRLAEQMDQLRRQRLEIEKSVRRVGEAFASGLDREALLEILVETAVGTCEADYGLVALKGHVGAEAEAGTGAENVQEAALAAEQKALQQAGPVEVEESGAYAFASSLGRIGQTAAPVGAMTIARGGRPFNSNEREVFLYLVGQAAASVENVALHELVSEQAVTDDLTGLANNRAFRELMEREAARAQRFGHDLSLLILDLDDFKRVNDTYGHPQGDAVLRMVGRVMAEESRGIDFPARYGGEEFVIALPETGTGGASELAERIRERLEAQAVRRLDGGGEIRVTASIGLATLPGSAANAGELIAKADAALYEAKRSGKNRVVVAEMAVPPGPASGLGGSKVPAASRRK